MSAMARKTLRLAQFPHQRALVEKILAGGVRRVVMQAGRGAGKTTTAMFILVATVAKLLKRPALYEIWWVTPTITGTGRKPWRHLCKIFAKNGPFQEYRPHIDKQTHTITLNDISIRLRAANAADSSSLEGDAINLCIYEEFGNKYITEALYNSLHPAVSRVNGTEVVLGTPPKDWKECQNGIFRRLWDEAMSGEDESLVGVQWRTLDMPVYGGGLLPDEPRVMDFAGDRGQALEEHIAALKALYKDRGELFEDAYRKAVATPNGRESLSIIAGGDDDALLRETFRVVIGNRLDVLKDIKRLIEGGKPEEAARIYEGEWLPGPQSLSEDILGWIATTVSAGDRHIITSDGIITQGAGSLWIWEQPTDGASYVIAADPAAGGGGDYSVAHVIRRGDEGRPAVIAAMYRSNVVPPDEFGKRLYTLAQWYDPAVIAVERTGAWGVASLIAVRDSLQPEDAVWVYTEANEMEPMLATSKDDFSKLGWHTTNHSMGVALTSLRRYLHTRQLVVPSKVVLDELKDFDWDLRTGRTGNDDTVKALAIGCRVMETVAPEFNQPEDEYEAYDHIFEERMLSGAR